MTKFLNFLIHIICYNQEGNFMAGGAAGGNSGGGEPDPNAGGGGEPGGAGGAPDPGASGGGGSPGDAVSYPSDLDATYHGNETILKHYDKEKKEFRLGNLMKSLVHATSSIGKEKITLPDNSWTEDQWREFSHKIGNPESVDKYEITNNVPEGMPANDKLMQGFKEVAHAAGVLPKQAQAIVDYFNNSMGADHKAQHELAEIQFKEGRENIEREYGAAFERKMKVAESGLNAFADQETIQKLTEKGFMDDPDFTKLFVKVGEALGEDKFNDDVAKKGQMTPEEIDAEIARFYEPTHPFSNPNHPERAGYEKRYLDLQSMKLKASGRENKVMIG